MNNWPSNQFINIVTILLVLIAIGIVIILATE